MKFSPSLTSFSDGDSTSVPERRACHVAGGPLSGELLLSGSGAPQQARSRGPVSRLAYVGVSLLSHAHLNLTSSIRCLKRLLWLLLSSCAFRSSKELLLQPVIISRNEKEKVLIEGSINSVRVSIAVKQVSQMPSVLSPHPSMFIIKMIISLS